MKPHESPPNKKKINSVRFVACVEKGYKGLSNSAFFIYINQTPSLEQNLGLHQTIPIVNIFQSHSYSSFRQERETGGGILVVLAQSKNSLKLTVKLSR